MLEAQEQEDYDKIYMKTVNDYFYMDGNTSGASIPVTMCANEDAMKQVKKRILMCGFGVGLSCGIVYGEVEI